MSDEQTELEKVQEAAEVAANAQSYKIGQQSQTRAPYKDLVARQDELNRRTIRASGRKPLFVGVSITAGN